MKTLLPLDYGFLPIVLVRRRLVKSSTTLWWRKQQEVWVLSNPIVVFPRTPYFPPIWPIWTRASLSIHHFLKIKYIYLLKPGNHGAGAGAGWWAKEMMMMIYTTNSRAWTLFLTHVNLIPLHNYDGGSPDWCTDKEVSSDKDPSGSWGPKLVPCLKVR